MSGLSYISTRGDEEGGTHWTFEEVCLQGLAPDGGLFVPKIMPVLSFTQLNSLKHLSLEEITFFLFRLYIEKEEIPDLDLKQILTSSFSSFSKKEITPLVPIRNKQGFWVLELFHGPTFAFKDIALQILGNLFDYFINRKKSPLRKSLTIVGATSGDTGSAAIYGLKGRKGIQVYMLHPLNRISSIQEAQMTTIFDKNVHNIAVDGTFDDCQEIVKILFSDQEFRSQYSLGAVNSINWARILAQMSYYFYSYFTVMNTLNLDFEEMLISYSVPTGNFGDILAGFYAKKMGLPITNLVIATNENDILDRFIKTGIYEKYVIQNEDGEKVFLPAKQTFSPAMDILISSNFERLLFHFLMDTLGSYREATSILTDYMKNLKEFGKFQVSKEIHDSIKKSFSSVKVSDQTTLEAISRVYLDYEYLLDPHTAVGFVAAEQIVLQETQVFSATIVLGTASPGKFPEVVLSAFENCTQKCPKKLDDFVPEPLLKIQNRPRRCINLCNSGNVKYALDSIRWIIEEQSRNN